VRVGEAWREWRATPRETLRRWDTHGFYVLVYPGITIGLWIGAGARAVDVVMDRERLASAIALVVCLVLGTALTWLAYVYLGRPVLDAPPAAPPPSPDVVARDESERRAWKSR
jgi:hypothetical protein